MRMVQPTGVDDDRLWRQPVMGGRLVDFTSYRLRPFFAACTTNDMGSPGWSRCARAGFLGFSHG